MRIASLSPPPGPVKYNDRRHPNPFMQFLVELYQHILLTITSSFVPFSPTVHTEIHPGKLKVFNGVKILRIVASSTCLCHSFFKLYRPAALTMTQNEYSAQKQKLNYLGFETWVGVGVGVGVHSQSYVSLCFLERLIPTPPAK